MEDTMNTTPVTQDTAAPKAKRTRTPRPKKDAAPAPVQEPVLDPPADRTLEQLEGEDMDCMTNGELKLVAQDLYNKCNELSKILWNRDTEIRDLTKQLNQHRTFTGYVRETIDHARNSLLLQADALNVGARGQKG